MIEPIQRPQGWTRADLEQSSSWIHQLTEAQIKDLENALEYALKTDKSFFEMSREDFPLSSEVISSLKDVIAATQTEHGFKLVRGFPVDRWTESELRTFYWGLSLQLGVPRPQGKTSSFISSVKNAGGVYRAATGRGFNTNAKLDFHSDGSDVVGLLVIRTAKSGGSSMISSSISAHNEMLRERPDLVDVLYQPFTFSRQGEEAPEEAPYYQAPIFGIEQGHFVCRYIRNHIISAQVAFPEVPRLTPQQLEALDLLDATLVREDLCYSMDFQPGDMQFINNHIVQHARTDYEDYEEEERKRHLLRVWLALPEAQPLPEGFRDIYKDVAPKAVRGGFRGINNSSEIREFEARLAQEHGMKFDIYKDQEGVSV